MLLRNIDLNFYPSISQNYKASQDGQLCIPAGPITYILTSSILNPGLVSNPPVPSKFKPGDENKIDYRSSENRADWKGYGNENDGGDGSEFEDSEGEDGQEGEDEVEGDVEDDKARPEFQFHWQKLEILQDEEVGDVMKGGVSFQLDQTFKEGFARQMEWSPLGAGRHRRCSLAILTTSRQVLLYQPTTVIGRGLKLQMKLLDRLIDQDVPGDEVVEIPWDRLPREICWSQPCTFNTQRWGISIFSMLDERNEFTFVKIVDEDIETLLKITPDLPEGSRIVNMHWSPWFVISPDEAVSFFSFITGNGVYLQTMVLSNVNGSTILSSPSELMLVSPGMLPGYEPHATIWYDRLYTLPKRSLEALLAIIQHDGIELFGVALDKDKTPRIPRRFKIEMDLPSCLAGYAFSDPLWKNYLDLNTCSTNGALSIFRIDLLNLEKSILYKALIPTFQGRTLVQNDPEFPHPIPWKRDFIDILDEKRDSFIDDWKIMQASCQVYGMAYCPLGGILSVCYRLKPEGVLEYPIKERERCTLSWELCRAWMEIFDASKTAESIKPFSLLGASGEAFVSDIRFLVEPEGAEEAFGKMDDVVAKVLAESGHIPLVSASAAKTTPETYQLHAVKSSGLSDRISLYLFNSNEAILLRARNLLGLLKTNKVAPKKPGVLEMQGMITKLILSSVLEIPILKESSMSSQKSRTIMWLFASLGIVSFYRDSRIFELAIQVMEALRDSWGFEMTAEKEIINERKEVLASPGNLDLLVKMKKKIERKDALEKCTVCGGKVPFDDLMNGRCERGHLFKRCALTFILITDSNSRVCGICSREYISKKMVEEDERMEATDLMDVDGTSESTLVRVLFEAVDTCVFCGGTFYYKDDVRKGGDQ